MLLVSEIPNKVLLTVVPFSMQYIYIHLYDNFQFDVIGITDFHSSKPFLALYKIVTQ